MPHILGLRSASHGQISSDANAVLRSIFNLCKLEISAGAYTFRDTTIAEVVTTACPTGKPEIALESFHLALQQLCNVGFIEIEGEDGKNGILRKRPLQQIESASDKLSQSLPATDDHDLPEKLNAAITERFPKLPIVKVLLTERGAEFFRR